MMANPQWKNYQPPVQDPAILAFSQPNMNKSTASGNLTKGGTAIYNGTNHANNSIRETGVVEKMLHSYGFIQCCDRDARLFFHFSEYSNNIETLKIGDPVQFQMSFDRRTGKPIAVSVVKMETGSVSFEVMSENRFKGVVMIEAKPVKHRNTGSTVSEGQLSYIQNGEHFFLPYTSDEVENNKKLSQDDKVSFYIATDKRTGKDHARQIQFEASQQERVQGVICSMKDTYGFIERADAVKEIFFHFSEFQGKSDDLALGDDVDFCVQSRNGKEVAVDIKALPDGTVIFEDVGLEPRRGRIQKTLRGSNGQKIQEPMAGRITYETVKGSIDIQFGDKDPVGEYTLNVGDLVQFKIATDRRDQLQRATQIELVKDTFTLNGEERETGIVASTKDAYGFIRCADREARMFFHFSEQMELGNGDIRPNDEVEFTVVPDPNQPTRLVGIRIRKLPRGTVKFETIAPEKLTGTVEKEPAGYNSMKSPGKNKESDPGIIMYDVNGTKQMIPYTNKTIQGNTPRYGDKVEFQIEESKRNNTKTAVHVRMVLRNKDSRQQGFVAAIKDNFGFIETADHMKEIFFHFSNFVGEDGEKTTESVDLGDEVEYTVTRKTNKVSAEMIRKLEPGTIPPEEEDDPTIYDGKIIRPMRIVNPDQEDYPGLVQVITEDDSKGQVYEYGITSLADKRDFLQKGDMVKFQLAVVTGTGVRRATHLAAKRKFQRAKVDSIKTHFGFLQYALDEDGKKLFFHMTEVHDKASLKVGDEVEFVVVHNQRSNKYSACSVRKVSSSGSVVEKKRERPERLYCRLKSVGDENGPKLTAIRQPRGPEGKGFQPRKPWPAAPNSA